MSVKPINNSNFSSYSSYTCEKDLSKINTFLEKDDAKCVKNGIELEVLKFFTNFIESGGYVWDLDNILRMNLDSTPAELLEHLQILSESLQLSKKIKAEKLEELLLRLHVSMGVLPATVQDDPTHLARKVFNKISHLLILRIREIKGITGDTFILSCGNQKNFIDGSEQLFCHFDQNKWQAHLFTIPNKFESDEKLMFAPLNASRNKGIVFDLQGKIVQEDKILIRVRKITESDAKAATQMILDNKDFSLSGVILNKRCNEIIEQSKKGGFKIDALYYTPWSSQSDKPNFAQFYSIYSINPPKPMNLIPVSLSINPSTNYEFDGVLKQLLLTFDINEDEVKEKMEKNPSITQQIVLDPQALETDNVMQSIDGLSESEIDELQNLITKYVITKDQSSPGTFKEFIEIIEEKKEEVINLDIAPKAPIIQLQKDQEAQPDLQATSKVKEEEETATPLSTSLATAPASALIQSMEKTETTLSNLQDISTISKIKDTDEAATQPVLIAPQLMQTDLERRSSLEKVERNNVVKIKHKGKQTKKTQKQPQKQSTNPESNNNAPLTAPSKLSHRDQKNIQGILSGKAIKGRKLIKLAMKMVDSVTNIKGSHHTAAKTDEDGKTQKTTIVKKHGGDNVVSAVSAKKVLKKIFALRNTNTKK